MPGGQCSRDPSSSDSLEDLAGCLTLFSQVDQATQEDRRVHEERLHQGQRSLSSSMRRTTSISGTLALGTVGTATSSLPRRTSFGPETARAMRTAPSSYATSISVPGFKPAISRIWEGITTRPALSMVVFMPSTYHITFQMANCFRLGRQSGHSTTPAGGSRPGTSWPPREGPPREAGSLRTPPAAASPGARCSPGGAAIPRDRGRWSRRSVFAR